MNRLISSRQRQKGLSTAGWIAVVAIFGFLVTTFFKVFPMYYGNFKVKSALEKLKQDETIDVKSRRAIWESLQKRLYVDDVKSVTKENLEITRKDGKTTITITYETRDNYIGNLFIGGRFVETVVIDR